MKKFTLFFVAVLTALSTNLFAAEEQLSLPSGKFADETITWTAVNGNIVIKQLKGNGNAVNSDYVSAPRVYRANILAFTCADGCTISEIAITYTGKYNGAGVIAGTAISTDNTEVTANTEAITASLGTATNGGTHTFTTTNTNGESAIYIQNGTTSQTENVQLRITAISITYIQTATGDVNVTEVTLDKTEETVEAGKTVTLTPTVSPINATNKNVTWSTSNAEVATVEDGVVTGVAEGSAVITVTTEDGNFTATCAITVTPARVLGKWQTTYTSMVTWTKGEGSGNEAKVNDYDAFKLGKSNGSGSIYITVPAYTTKLYIHAAAWTGKSDNTLSIEGTDITATPSTLNLTADAAVSGTGTTYNIANMNADAYFFEVTLTGVTAETKLTLKCNERCVVWGINYEVEEPEVNVATPILTPEEGKVKDNTFVEAFTLTMSSETEGAEIYYTLDGTNPIESESALEYTAPITIAKSTKVRAIAMDENAEFSLETSVTYCYINTAATAYSVSEAIDVINADLGLSYTLFVKGTIKSITEVSVYDVETQKGYGNATYVITDGTNDMTIYRGYYLDNTYFTSEDQITKGDSVVVCGKLLLYGDIYEVGQGNYIVSYTPDTSTEIDNATVAEKAVKMIENGQLVIIREGVKYNAQGVRL